MTTMRTVTRTAFALLAITTATATYAQDPKPPADWSRRLLFSSPDGRFTLQLTNRLQVRFDEINVDTPTPTAPAGQSGADQSNIRIRRARTTLEGKAFGDVSYKLQLGWVDNPTLLDAELRYTKYPLFQPWLGRGKAFFGRQQLTSSGRLQFVDRSIVDAAFFPGRQNGVAITGELPSKVLEYQVGVYNGNGIANNANNDDDNFLTTARVVWHPFGNIPLEESAFDYPAHPKLAIGVGMAQNEATTFTAAAGTTPALTAIRDFDRLGGELAFRWHGLNAVAEYVTEDADRLTISGPINNPTARATLAPENVDGYYVQVGYLFPNQRFEVAVRQAQLTTERERLGSAARTESEQTEQRVAFSWYLVKHDYKLQLDYGKLETENTVTGATTGESDELRAQIQVSF